MNAALPVITPLYAGLLAFLLIALAVNVSKMRVKHKVGLGDGGVPELIQAMRVQGNFTEYAPLGLMLMLIVELLAFPGWAVHALGAMLVVGRAAHAFGFARNPGRSFGRFIGMILTWLVLVVGGLMCIYAGVQALM
jgi:uncharacterized membrane protein YecN with MAPEG domain